MLPFKETRPEEITKMLCIPYEKMAINWAESNPAVDDRFTIMLPWLSMEFDVTQDDKNWIRDAIAHLHTDPLSENVQKFIKELKDYPVFYVKPRLLTEFEGKDLQECPSLDIDTSTPSRLIETFGCPIGASLKEDVLSSWTWDQEAILKKARIDGTELYDPVSIVSYLICYRLDWESKTWLGQDGFGIFLETLLRKDEQRFFEAIGWIAKQSWYVTTESYGAMKPALTHFPKMHEVVSHFMTDEIGHYKFMEQVFDALDLNKDDFPVGDGTKWLLACHKRTAVISPLAFSAMVNVFEAAYYEGNDPISRVVELSSRPHAAHGYDLHYKINQEHRHCDMPINMASYLVPQTRDHVLLTLGVFELTLNLLDSMEQNLVKKLENN